MSLPTHAVVTITIYKGKKNWQSVATDLKYIRKFFNDTKLWGAAGTLERRDAILF